MSTSINPHLDLPSDPTAVELFTEFFAQHYADQIQKYPDLPGRSITVDYEDFNEFDEQKDYSNLVDSEDEDDHFWPLNEALTNSPTHALHYAEKALQEYDPSIRGLENAAVRLTNHDNRIPIRDIRRGDVNNLVTIEGIVSKATDVQPRASVAKFQCRFCGTEIEVPQPTEEREEPFQCPNEEECGTTQSKAFRLLTENSQIVNYQKVQIQESPDDLKGGQTPQSIDVALHGDITGKVTPGERVTLTGVLKAKDTKNSSVFTLYIQGNNIQMEDQEFEELVVTEDEEKRIRELAEDPEVYKKLHKSLAPTIQGHKTEKLAAVFQLFGGVRKHLPDGSSIRGDIHTLYVGDPGTGKSQILRRVDMLSPRGIYTSGKGSSSAGLTAAAVRDSEFNDQWTLEAGAMVLADKGVAAIDELDKMSDSDRSAMHEALEQQTVSVSKAGINATLKSRCSLLAAANPKQGRWQEHEPIPAQIDLQPALVSRFDLIFTVRDQPEEAKDRKIAQHILKSNRTGERYANGKELDRDDNTAVGEVETDLFQKYVAYARKNCRPELTKDAMKKIEDFYVGMRDHEGDNDAIPVTARKLEALVRLAEAAARIRLSDDVTVDDANTAIRLTKESMRQVGLDPETGEFDADMIEAGQSTSQRDRASVLKEIIDTLSTNSDTGLASLQKIKTMAEGQGYDHGKVEKTLTKLGRSGEVVEPKTDQYRLP